MCWTLKIPLLFANSCICRNDINYFFADSECIFRRYFCDNIMPQRQTTVFSIIWLQHICPHTVHLVPKDNTRMVAILGLNDLEKLWKPTGITCFSMVFRVILKPKGNTHPNSWRTVLDHLFQASLFHLQSREHYCCSLTDVYQCLGFHCEMSNKSFETSNPSLSKSWKSCILLVASGFNVSSCISVGVRMRFPTYVLPSWSETRFLHHNIRILTVSC